MGQPFAGSVPQGFGFWFDLGKGSMSVMDTRAAARANSRARARVGGLFHEWS